MNTLTRRRLLALSAASASLPLLGRPAWASSSYPSRTIKWVVPYLAGTAPDNAARILGEAVGKILKQTVIIENRAGAGGNIGARQVAQATADGYTLLYTASPLASNMRLFKKPGYDALKDFRHIIGVSKSDVVLVVHPDSDIQTLDDLLARLKAQPGQISYASGGVGTPSHLGMELLLNNTGTQALHVPYKGATELINAVVGEQVVFGMPIYSVALSLIQSGKLRALGLPSPQRNPTAPDVPTFAELGVPDTILTSWGGVSVPAGTPDEVAQRLYDAFAQALQRPDVVQKMEAQGGRVEPQGSEQFVRSIRDEMALTGRMMEQVGLEPF